MRLLKSFGLYLPLGLSAISSWAAPVDWHGSFGVDTTAIGNFRYLDSETIKSTGDGTQEVALGAGLKDDASFQTYLFKLSPEMIINDAVTLHMEFSPGYARGGRFGESPAQNSQGTSGFANALYYHNTTLGKSFNLNQFYAKIYSDTATYRVGRHAVNFGMGAILNSGEGLWDRHFSIRDGITLDLKIGNFQISPFWAKTSSGSTYTRGTKSREYGITLGYDNPDKDMSFGLLFMDKEDRGLESNLYTQDTTNDGTTNLKSIGTTDIRLIDLTLKKRFKDFTVQAEVPLFSGKIGKLYGNDDLTKYKGKAYLLKGNWAFSNKWDFGLDIGLVNGHPGGTSNYEALYLHPNFRPAYILFAYNRSAIGNASSANVFDSYVTNTKYLKLSAKYTADTWDLNAGLIHAIADEVADSGTEEINHETNKLFTATQNQDDSMGTEVDLGVNYFWNKEVTIGVELGYLFTGDYYSFTNDSAVSNEAGDAYLIKLSTMIKF